MSSKKKDAETPKEVPLTRNAEVAEKLIAAAAQGPEAVEAARKEALADQGKPTATPSATSSGSGEVLPQSPRGEGFTTLETMDGLVWCPKRLAEKALEWAGQRRIEVGSYDESLKQLSVVTNGDAQKRQFR